MTSFAHSTAPAATLAARPSTAPAILPPQRPLVGSWRIGRLLGRGPATEVRAAQPADCSPDWPCDYVVKLARPKGDESLALQLLRREALAASQVEHPHLVSLLAAQIHTQPYHLVMPYLPGASLGQVLASGWRMSLPQALWAVRQVAEALAALHTRGWLHGDVKPDNIVVSPQGHATLIDLGFAARLETLVAGPPDSFRGSPRYAAPERWSERHRVTAASDLYSLGATLFELVTGQPPFPGDDAEVVIAAHRDQPAPDPRQHVPQLPNRVSWMIRQLLSKEPLRRPRGGEELVRLLVELEIEVFADR